MPQPSSRGKSRGSYQSNTARQQARALAQQHAALAGHDHEGQPLPPAAAPFVRHAVHASLLSLLSDPFWAEILQTVSAPAALYAYCLLSGLPRADAAAVALSGTDLDLDLDLTPFTPADLASLLATLDLQARPVLRRAAIAAGVTEFWAIRHLKDIAEDPSQPAAARIDAIRAGLGVMGKLGGPSSPAPAPSSPPPSPSTYIGEVHINQDQRLTLQQIVSDSIQSLLPTGESGIQIPVFEREEQADDNTDPDADRPSPGGPADPPDPHNPLGPDPYPSHPGEPGPGPRPPRFLY